MNVEVLYNNSLEKVKIEDASILDVLSPSIVETCDERNIVENAILNPINAQSFAEFLGKEEDVLVIVNDATKPSPTAKILEYIEPFLKFEKTKFLVATGTHRAPTEEELDQIFGRFFRGRVFIHDSKKEDDMVFLGKTSRNTEVKINQLAIEASKILLIGSAEPHYFAGFTGGRKAIIPGIAGFQTIEQNHSLALEKEAISLKLKGNPIHDDIVEGIGFLKKDIFSIQAVLDHERRICFVAAGDLYDSHANAVEKAKQLFTVSAKGKADIVVAVVKPPWDINFYQSQQAVENAKFILKDSGILILVSACLNGLGGGHYYSIMSSCSNPEGIGKNISKENYKLGAHKAKRFAELLVKSDLWAVTKLQGSEIKKMFMTPYDNIQKAVDDAFAKKGKNAKISFLLDGATTVPVIKG